MEGQTRKKTFVEKQPYLLAYGFGISLFSPSASLYQLLKLNPQVKLSNSAFLRLSARILPQQTILKTTQMNISTPVKEQLNPWAAFALVGVLQGGVYGQANIFFAKELAIGKAPSYQGLFRGVLFAGARDMLSQGVPFVFSEIVRRNVLDKVYPSSGDPTSAEFRAKQWCAVIGTSIFSTYASQGLHNCQILMQANQELGYLSTLQKGIKENGVRLLYRGAEARVGLLLLVNILNELLLKKAWEEVPV